MRYPIEFVCKRSLLLLALMLSAILLGHELMSGLDASASAGTTKPKTRISAKAMPSGQETTKGQRAIELARTELETAMNTARAMGSGINAAAVHEARSRYEAAVALRVAEIRERMAQFELLMGSNAGTSVQDSIVFEETPAEYLDLQAELASYRTTTGGMRALASASEPVQNDPAAEAARLANQALHQSGKDAYTIVCPPQPITSNLGVAGGNAFKFIGTATQRLNRNGVQSECGVPRTQAAPIAGTFTYDEYVFSNTTANPVCISILLKVVETTASNYMVGAFSPTFNPANLTQNWLGDPGLSSGIPPVPQGFSVNVPANSGFRVVVSNTNASGDGGAYELNICGIPSCPACPTCTLTCPANITVTTGPTECSAVVTYLAPTTTGVCGTVSCTPGSGSSFPVGTTTVNCTSSTFGGACSFTVTVQQRFVLADDGNGNCLVVTRNSCGSSAATYCWKRANNTTVTGPCTMSVTGGTTVNIQSTGADPNYLQGGASLSTRKGNARLTVPKTPPFTTLQLVDTNIDNSSCTCP